MCHESQQTACASKLVGLKKYNRGDREKYRNGTKTHCENKDSI